jgi:hypothetical protein
LDILFGNFNEKFGGNFEFFFVVVNGGDFMLKTCFNVFFLIKQIDTSGIFVILTIDGICFYLF